MNLFEGYKDHVSSYGILDFSHEELKKLVKPLEYRKNEKKWDEYLGLKWAGEFFAYGREVCWVYIVNNRTNSKIKMRHYGQGFYVTITTSDDMALYGDWKKSLTNEKMGEVIKFFDKLPSLLSYEDMCRGLNRVIGIKGHFENS